MKIILATTSPYRKQAFEFLGLDFTAEDSKIEEKFSARPEKPEELVKHLAKLKAEAVAKKHSDGIVIGFDSIGFFNGKILEKPSSREEAFQRLKQLSGKRFEFFSGVHMINASTGKSVSKAVRTEILMRELTKAEIMKYLDQDPKVTTYAHGFEPVHHYSSTFARNIVGSYNNFLRGIPLEVLPEMLKEVEK